MASELSYSYGYQLPEQTYTLDQFKACQSDDDMCHFRTSFLNRIGHIQQTVYNVTSDYLDDILQDYAVNIELDKDEFARYKYKPKLLAYDIYGDTELYFLILLINDMYSCKQFTKKKIKMLSIDDMSYVANAILNNNDTALNKYNDENA